jgi:demethylmenaquinone methyltransferase/2-methoxy-6-polyprenyl-1,4-benzoquinol methylase
MSESHSHVIDNANPGERKQFVRAMFDSIAPTYDLLNRLLSLSIDARWRKRLVHALPSPDKGAILDLCAGTGELSKLIQKIGRHVRSLDFSLTMLMQGVRRKAIVNAAIGADAGQLPFKKETFAAATIAFGIRNLPDLDLFLDEVHRVLAPGGFFAILELTRPDNPIMMIVYRFYLTVLLPVIGGLLSGNWKAYRYLSNTIKTFIHPRDLSIMLGRHGFQAVRYEAQTFGIAGIITCQKAVQ